MTVVSTPFHFLGFWCILYKTPDQMKAIKWHLVNLQIWIFLFDYLICFLAAPYIMFPFLAGLQLGVLGYFFPFNALEVTLILLTYVCVGVGIVLIFENRFHTLCLFRPKIKSFWAFLRGPCMGFHYPLMIAGGSPFLILAPEQTSARKHMFEKLPCLPKYLYEAPIFVFADDYTYHAIIGLFTVLGLALEAVIFITFLVWNAMQQVKSHAMSRKTYEMQKKFFIALLIQLLVPFFFMFIPLSSAWIMVLKDYFNQAMVNIGMVMISMHGVLSSIVMVSVHRPYRQAVMAWFAKKKISISVEVSEKPERARNNHFLAVI